MAVSNTLYTPTISSPLNPTSTTSESHFCNSARVHRRRKPQRPGRPSPGSHTLAQRFLRVKAAEAWRGLVLCAEVAQYESDAAAAASSSTTSVQPLVSGGRKSRASQKCGPPLPMLKNFAMGTPFYNVHRVTSGFRLSDLSCLATRRMLLAMGLMGMVPALKVREMLNQAKPL